MTARAWIVLLGTLAAACSAPLALETCEPEGGLTPWCGFSNPEDVVLAPGGVWLLVSQMARGEAAGSLVAWRPADAATRLLWPAPAGAPVQTTSAGCPGPPDAARFAPHGIDLAERPQAPAELLVVNHGGREAVERFELTESAGEPSLAWRGCAVLPERAVANDVAALPDGGFVVTRMFEAASGLRAVLGALRLACGTDTGFVLEWTAGGGWRELPGTRASGPNGVEVSPDGSLVYVAEWSGRRLLRVRRAGEPERAEVELPHLPDNLTWTRDGRLLVAGQEGGLVDALRCGQLASGTCGLAFSVVVVDPATLVSRVLLRHAGRATGAASVALEVGGDLYVGTFAGDRLARAAMPR